MPKDVPEQKQKVKITPKGILTFFVVFPQWPVLLLLLIALWWMWP